MNIRQKTVIIVATVFSILIVLHIATYGLFILGSYSDVEENILKQDLERVVTAFGDDINHLDSVAVEWSNTESVRNYLNDESSGNIKGLLGPETFERLQFNLINFYNAEGEKLDGAEYDLVNYEFKGVDYISESAIKEFNYHSYSPENRDGLMGIIILPKGPVMITSRPVAGADSGDEIIGTIVMARYFDDRMLDRLSAITNFPVIPVTDSEEINQKMERFSDYDETSYPLVTRYENDLLYLFAPMDITPADEDNLLGTILINDVYGDEKILFEITIPRAVYLQGKSTVIFSILLFILSAIVMEVVIFLLLEKFVLSRTSKLSRSVNEIGKKRDFSQRVVDEGSDEISSLSDGINGMLGELESSQKQLRTKLDVTEERYRLFFNSGNDIVLVCGNGKGPGRFIEVNNAAVNILGYSKEEFSGMGPEEIIREEIPDDPGFLRRMKEGHSFFTVYFVAKDGREIPFEVSAHIFNNFGTPATLMIARDITERVENENMRAETLKQLEKNIGQLAVLNDHLRNPLQVIMSHVLLGEDGNPEVILNQIEEITVIVHKLDKGWLESLKIRDYLVRYHGMNYDEDEAKRNREDNQ
ncbi:CHASE4 domain-containing protein [Methanoplanus limicola]|uniref:histidine kinase n=1 Tax=Methanoplanus limicola DSM 2279 TaxID=937775 RepID=H1YWZ2_9EURY|nr:CHASE4 domain-containing protein [Methanoplanus limicola]EHQ34915.1 putative PAS/PAC sensor protein [Methanoplanus limicola DSM 2279]